MLRSVTSIPPPRPVQAVRQIYSSCALRNSSAGPKPTDPSSTGNRVPQSLRDWTARAATVFREKADGFTGSTKVTLSKLGAELNKVSGYEEIENLKRRVVAQEALITTSRQAARQAKKSHDEAVLQRSNSQREVNDLLQRKSTWDDADVVRFTALVRQDHLFEQAEMQAKRTVEETDLAVDREFSELMRAILARYHEEQVWSDKIRSASTYGQMAVLGLNLLVFLTAIVVVEPWKRRRLAETFEQKITEMNQEYRQALEGAMGNVEKLLEARTPLPVIPVEVDIPVDIPYEVPSQPITSMTPEQTTVVLGVLITGLTSIASWLWLTR